ncbi:MAG: amino acid ABC transporter substrate-binding protein [Pseudomonadota bacterium]
MTHRLAAVFAFALLAAPAGAEELTGTLKKIKETGEIAIGYRDTSIPFSYIDDNQKPIGFAMDICYKIVDAVKAELKLPKLEVKLVPVTSSTRIPLMANGTTDLECGSTTNNAERQKQVWYTNAHFLSVARYVTKVASHITKVDDFKGKTVSSTAGSTNIKQIVEYNAKHNLGITIVPTKDVAEGFLMLETDRAAAFFNDDVVLASLVAISKDPKAYVIGEDGMSLPEPYGIMVRKDDVPFKKLADATTAALYTSPEGPALYAKWFQQPIPPHGINLNLPMTSQMRKAMAQPNDSPDPSAY